MSRPLTLPPRARNAGGYFFYDFWDGLLGGTTLLDLLNAAYLILVTNAVKRQQSVQITVASLARATWTGDADTLQPADFEAHTDPLFPNWADAAVGIANDTFTSLGGAYPQTVVGIALAAGIGGGDAVLAYVPLVDPWVVTADGQTMSVKPIVNFFDLQFKVQRVP